MGIQIFRSSNRGTASHGWLQARFSFSFGDYFNPLQMGFGLLRVLNDDIIKPGAGFPMHPHDNMEIVTIILEGALAHKDSAGFSGVIKPGDVQRMSAGSGIVHSEFNHSKKEPCNTLQTWIHTKEQNISPSYEQKHFSFGDMKNTFLPLVSGEKNENTVYIHQDAAYYRGILDEGTQLAHALPSPRKGVYAFVIEGKVSIDGTELGKRDAAGITRTAVFEVKALEKSDVLLIEVPLS